VIEHIPIYHRQSRLDQLVRNKDAALNIQHRCQAPHRYLIVDWAGECFLCACEVWLPVSVGRIEDFQELRDIWNSTRARALQHDIDTGQFTWCAIDMCGIRNHDILYSRHVISINIDRSCNLRCPSCRSEKIMYTQGPELDLGLQRARHLVGMLERFEEPCHVIMSGNGDVLASNIMRPIVHEYQPRPQQTFRIFTNGLLMKKQLERSRLLPAVTEFQISIDAGTAETYERVRLGGRWHTLLENFEFLHPIAQQNRADVWLMFVLQAANWRDLFAFADLAGKYGWTANITKLVDWGTWREHDQHDVIGNADHPEHDLALAELAKLHQAGYNHVHLDAALTAMIK
jgi:molybdenum cofactor biosynthesis enzyme MoaA